MLKALRDFLLLIIFIETTAIIPAADFVHPLDIVKEMKAKFKSMKSYQAEFKIVVKSKKGSKISSGTAYYKEGGLLNFTFSKPSGDTIISNGKQMWVYISKLKTVGIQDLKYKKAGKSIYNTASYDGLVSLFTRYHYKFEGDSQPRDFNGQNFYILKLKEKEASGGFSKLILYVDANSKLIHRIEAQSESGRNLLLQFSSIQMNENISSSKFRFKVESYMKSIRNPLTTE